MVGPTACGIRPFAADTVNSVSHQQQQSEGTPDVGSAAAEAAAATAG